MDLEPVIRGLFVPVLALLSDGSRDTLAKRNVDIICSKLAVLDGFFGRHEGDFVWQRPKAGPVAFPRLVGEEIDVFCETLVQTAGVLLAPGKLFDDRKNYFRIGFGRRSLPQAVARLASFLDHRTT